MLFLMDSHVGMNMGAVGFVCIWMCFQELKQALSREDEKRTFAGTAQEATLARQCGKIQDLEKLDLILKRVATGGLRPCGRSPSWVAVSDPQKPLDKFIERFVEVRVLGLALDKKNNPWDNVDLKESSFDELCIAGSSELEE